MSTSGKGKTLLFEHLPYIRFGGSIQGVLFLVFANGEAYFYPLNDKTKGDSPNSAKMITLEQSGRKFVRQAGNLLQSRNYPVPHHSEGAFWTVGSCALMPFTDYPPSLSTPPFAL